MEWLLYISITIIAVAFVFLVYYLIKTLVSMRKTLDNLDSTVQGLQQQMDGITKESTELLHKTNKIADDIQQKSDSLNSVVIAAKDLGESFQRINLSVRRMSETITKKTDERSDQVAQAVQWGNAAFDFWAKWKSKKAKFEKETSSKP